MAAINEACLRATQLRMSHTGAVLGLIMRHRLRHSPADCGAVQTRMRCDVRQRGMLFNS
jgi:hypothetical protein